MFKFGYQSVPNNLFGFYFLLVIVYLSISMNIGSLQMTVILFFFVAPDKNVSFFSQGETRIERERKKERKKER